MDGPIEQLDQPIAAGTAEDAAATYSTMATTEITASYRDYSRYLELGGDLARHKKCESNFPARIHRMVSNADHSDIVGWLVRRRPPPLLKQINVWISSASHPRYL